MNNKKPKKIITKSNFLTAPKNLKILVSIVERSKAAFYLDVLEGYDVNFQTIMYGKGTAPTEISHYLGLLDDSKAVIFSIVAEDRINEILQAYEEKYFKIKHGKGIAFTIPISSIIGVMIYQFLTNKGEK